MATKPLNILSGLNDALVQPLWGDIKDAYWMQRAARERYPIADTALNFIPYVGVAAGVDDIIQDTRQANYGELPADLGGLGVGSASTMAALKGFGKVAAQASKAARGITGIAGVGLTGFAQASMREQDAAAKKYEGMSIKDIADQLRQLGPQQ